MIIDFHTHVFPDKIASKTIEILSQKGCITPYTDGSVDGLLSAMKEANVDIAVCLPVVTKPSQFDSINRFALEINERFRCDERRLISFAGIHPKCENISEKMRFIKDSGFVGVKIHPDYQETFINDEGYIEIINNARELDLVVITHAGVDAGYRDMPARCTPELALEVIRKTGHKKLVFAHLGANEMPERVLSVLCGQDVYFDTALILKGTSENTFKEILDKHGADKILFATDSPWSGIENDVNIIRSYNLEKETENKIFCENAKRLLGIR